MITIRGENFEDIDWLDVLENFREIEFQFNKLFSISAAIPREDEMHIEIGIELFGEYTTLDYRTLPRDASLKCVREVIQKLLDNVFSGVAGYSNPSIESVSH